MRSDFRFFLVLCCFTFSGVAALVYETAWSQHFALAFGSSELAVAAVLAAYMAGLAAGAAFSARWTTRMRKPLLVYALLEFGIGVSALLVPWALRLADSLQLTLLGGVELPPDATSLGSAVFYLGAAFVILLVPTAMMGATLPFLARFSIRIDREIGPRIGLLYTANTLGAAIGALLAAFVLLPRLGLTQTIVAGVLFNGAAFITAAVLSQMRAESVAEKQPVAPKSEELHYPRLILILIAASGFASFGYEVLWTRLLSHFFGGSVYSFGAMLATFLFGIAFGSAVASRFARSRASAQAAFAATQLGIGTCFWLAFIVVDHLPGAISSLPVGGAILPQGAPVAALLLLPGAVFIGATFPLAVRITTVSPSLAGAASARVYAWNTVGSICGAIITGFVLLPKLQIAGTLVFAVMLNLVLAATASLAFRKLRPVVVATSLVGAILLTLLPPSQPWRVLRSSAIADGVARGDVSFCGVGRSSTVLLIDQDGEWRLTTNGLPESAIQPRGARFSRYAISRWLGLLPFAYRAQAETVLIIGLGAGLTVDAIPLSAREIHVVELEPEVVRANRWVGDRRARDTLGDPRLHIHLNDARSGLALSPKRFDVIVSQPSHPWTVGSANLFTREFFALVSERLSDDGVFVQWIGLRFINEPLLRSLLATLCDVFADVEVYQPHPHGALLFVASQGNLVIADSATAGFRGAEPMWRNLGILAADEISLARILDTVGSRAFARDAPLVVDNHNLLMINSPGALQSQRTLNWAESVLAQYDPLLTDRSREIDLATVRHLLAEGANTRAGRVANTIEDREQRIVATALTRYANGNHQAAKNQLLNLLNAETGYGEALHAFVYMAREDILRGHISPPAAAALQRDPVAAQVVEGWRLARLKRFSDLAAMEHDFVSIPAGDLLWNAARNLRIVWRQASGDPLHAGQALEIFEPSLAFVGKNWRPLLQRAQLALTAQDFDRVFASLNEVVGAARSNANAQEYVGRMHAILEALPKDLHTDNRWIALDAALQKIGHVDQ